MSDFTFIYIWVHDIIVVVNSVEWLLEALWQDFRIKDLGTVSMILCIKIYRDCGLRTLCFSQSHYVEVFLDSHGIIYWKSVGTLLHSNVPLVSGTEEEIEAFWESIHNYCCAVGSVNYISQCTWPDVSHSFSLLLQFLENPKLGHWAQFKRVVCYLHRIPSLGLLYGFQSVKITLNKLQAALDGPLVAFSDSDWAGCQISRWSTSGYVFRFIGGAISWQCKKQSTVALSLTEEKYKGFWMQVKKMFGTGVWWRLWVLVASYQLLCLVTIKDLSLFLRIQCFMCAQRI